MVAGGNAACGENSASVRGFLSAGRGFTSASMCIFYWRMVAGSGVLPTPRSDVLPTPFVINCRFKISLHTCHTAERLIFSARLFRQGVAKVNGEARYEYLKDTCMDLARPWP